MSFIWCLLWGIHCRVLYIYIYIYILRGALFALVMTPWDIRYVLERRRLQSKLWGDLPTKKFRLELDPVRVYRPHQKDVTTALSIYPPPIACLGILYYCPFTHGRCPRQHFSTFLGLAKCKSVQSISHVHSFLGFTPNNPFLKTERSQSTRVL